MSSFGHDYTNPLPAPQRSNSNPEGEGSVEFSAPPSRNNSSDEDSIFVRAPLSTLVHSQEPQPHTQQSNPSFAHTQSQEDVHTAPFTQESLQDGSQTSSSQEPTILSSSTPPGSVSAAPLPFVEIHSRNHAVIRLVCSRPNQENQPPGVDEHQAWNSKWLEHRTRSQQFDVTRTQENLRYFNDYDDDQGHNESNSKYACSSSKGNPFSRKTTISPSENVPCHNSDGSMGHLFKVVQEREMDETDMGGRQYQQRTWGAPADPPPSSWDIDDINSRPFDTGLATRQSGDYTQTQIHDDFTTTPAAPIFPYTESPHFELVDERWFLSAYLTKAHLSIGLRYLGDKPFRNQVTIKLLPHNDAPVGSEVIARNLFVELSGASNDSHTSFDYFVSLSDLPAYLDHDTLVISVNLPEPSGLAGLQNQGATCYISSFIQVLYHLRIFRRSILAAALEPGSHDITAGLAETFYDLMTKPTASTRVLTSSFGYNTQEVLVQHDLHELSRLLLDKIEKDGDCSIFDLKVTTRIACLNVEYTSERPEPFSDFGLDVDGCSTLSQSLDKFAEKERLDGDNKYDAGELHGKQDAEMFRKISVCPKVLNIHLKRFGFDYTTMTHNKISTPLEFPVTLDLSPYCDEGSGAIYHLYSVIIHNGTVNSGHYYIYIRPHLQSYIPGSGRENEWFCANDETVMRCDRSDMENEGRRGAYCLYYIRDDCVAEVLGPVAADAADSAKDYPDLPPGWENRTKREGVHIPKEVTALGNDNVIELTFFTDRDVRAQLSASHLETKGNISYDLFFPPPDTQTFKVSKSDPYTVIITHVCRAIGCDVSEVGIWACKSTQEGLLRIERPLDQVDITNGEENSGKTGASIATVGEVLASQEISKKFIYVDVLTSNDMISLNDFSRSTPYVKLCDDHDDDKNGQRKSNHDGGDEGVSPDDVLEGYLFHPVGGLKVHHIIKMEKNSGGTRFRLAAKVYKDCLLVDYMERFARTELDISRPWVYCLKYMREHELRFLSYSSNEKRSSTPLHNIVYIEEAVEGMDTPFTSKIARSKRSSGLECMKLSLFNKAHTFRLDFRPCTYDDGDERSIVVDTLGSIKQVESSVGERLGFDLTLTPSDPAGRRNVIFDSSPSSSIFHSDFVEDKTPGYRFVYYHKKVPGVKVGIWEGGQLKVTVAKVDESGVIEDVMKDLGEGNWRVLFLNDGEFVETVRRGERLCGYFNHADSRVATKAIVRTGDLGALEYNKSGSKGAVEDVVFAAEKIDDDVGELDVGECVRTTAVPLVVEVGTQEGGQFSSFGVPLLSHLNEEDTADSLIERVCTKSGLSSAGASLYILGERCGGWNRPLNSGALWDEVKTQFKGSFRLGGNSFTLGLLGLTPQGLPHGSFNKDHLPRVGICLPEDTIADLRASRAKFMSIEWGTNGRLSQVRFDDNDRPIAGSKRRKGALQLN